MKFFYIGILFLISCSSKNDQIENSVHSGADKQFKSKVICSSSQISNAQLMQCNFKPQFRFTDKTASMDLSALDIECKSANLSNFHLFQKSTGGGFETFVFSQDDSYFLLIKKNKLNYAFLLLESSATPHFEGMRVSKSCLVSYKTGSRQVVIDFDEKLITVWNYEFMAE